MFKENCKQAVALYGRTFLASVMGLFIYLSIGVLVSIAVPRGETMSAATSFVMNLIALVLQGGLFYLIVYSRLWELGDKNSNAVQFGRMAADPLRGLKIGALAAVPSFLSFVLLLADKLVGIWSYAAAFYRVCQLGLYPVIVWSMGPNVMTTTAEIPLSGILCAGLPVLFVPAVACLAYYLGFRQIAVWENIVFVRKKK